MREHIEKEAVVHIEKFTRVLCRKHGVVDAQLRKDTVVERVGIRSMKRYVWRKLRLRDPEEFVIVLTQHHNVGVVVPRDESVMAHRAEQRSSREEITDIMLAADTVDVEQVSQKNILDNIELALIGILKYKLAVAHAAAFNKHLDCVLQADFRLTAAADDF